MDFAVTLPLALPVISYWLLGYIYHVDQVMLMNSPVPTFEPIAMLFVNITGVLGVIWAVARISTPTEALARLDALARIVVAALIIHAITWGATPVLWLYVVSEIGGSAAQLIGRPRRT